MNADDTRRDPLADDESRKTTKSSIEHRKTVHELEEIQRTHGGRVEKRVS